MQNLKKKLTYSTN